MGFHVCFFHLGPPHDLFCTEVRKDSLVLLWKEPVYTGRSPVSGYYVDVKETEATDEHWKSANEKTITKRFLKVKQFGAKFSYTSETRNNEVSSRYATIILVMLPYNFSFANLYCALSYTHVMPVFAHY